MPVCFVIDVPGGTLDKYDQIREALGAPLGEGQIGHVAGSTPNGIRVVDVWDSREAFDRFMQEHLGEQLAAAGFQPEVAEFDVHAAEFRD
jgi:hypothetical protein